MVVECQGPISSAVIRMHGAHVLEKLVAVSQAVPQTPLFVPSIGIADYLLHSVHNLAPKQMTGLAAK